MLQGRYFILTIFQEEGAQAALLQNPLTIGLHIIYLYHRSTRSQYPLWIGFPLVDGVFYKTLREICLEIEVVWSGKNEDYLRKSSISKVYVLIENTKNI